MVSTTSLAACLSAASTRMTGLSWLATGGHCICDGPQNVDRDPPAVPRGPASHLVCHPCHRAKCFSFCASLFCGRLSERRKGQMVTSMRKSAVNWTSGSFVGPVGDGQLQDRIRHVIVSACSHVTTFDGHIEKGLQVAHDVGVPGVAPPPARMAISVDMHAPVPVPSLPIIVSRGSDRVWVAFDARGRLQVGEPMKPGCRWVRQVCVRVRRCLHCSRFNRHSKRCQCTCNHDLRICACSVPT